MTAYLIGEANPYGGWPEHALYPYPASSAGGRLCHEILGLGETDYLRLYRRINLYPTPPARWSLLTAREHALALLGGTHWSEVPAPVQVPPQGTSAPSPDVLVVLGARTAGAFFRPSLPRPAPFTPYVYHRGPPTTAHLFLCLPHPSGRCRKYTPANVARARTAIRALLGPEYAAAPEDPTT